jgi:hypothetical protein
MGSGNGVHDPPCNPPSEYIKTATTLGGVAGLMVGLFQRLGEVQLPKEVNLSQLMSGNQKPSLPAYPLTQLSGRVFLHVVRGGVVGATYASCFCYFKSTSMNQSLQAGASGLITGFIGASLCKLKEESKW